MADEPLTECALATQARRTGRIREMARSARRMEEHDLARVFEGVLRQLAHGKSGALGLIDRRFVPPDVR